MLAQNPLRLQDVMNLNSQQTESYLSVTVFPPSSLWFAVAESIWAGSVTLWVLCAGYGHLLTCFLEIKVKESYLLQSNNKCFDKLNNQVKPNNLSQLIFFICSLSKFPADLRVRVSCVVLSYIQAGLHSNIFLKAFLKLSSRKA